MEFKKTGSPNVAARHFKSLGKLGAPVGPAVFCLVNQPLPLTTTAWSVPVGSVETVAVTLSCHLDERSEERSIQVDGVSKLWCYKIHSVRNDISESILDFRTPILRSSVA